MPDYDSTVVASGADFDALMTKLGGIEAGATADQTGTEIKSLYEAEVDTNAFTDAEKTKLAGIEAGAEVNAVDSVNGSTGTIVLDPDDLDDTLTTNKFITAGDISKLAGIESGATGDQTGAEIKSLYEAELNTNAFTDAEKTKLAGISAGAEVNAVDSVNGATGVVVLDPDDLDDTATLHKFISQAELTKLGGIEAGADVTDTANVTAAGALMDSEVTNLAQVKAFDSSDYATAAQGALADSALQSVAAADITDVSVDGIALITALDANPFTDADETKLDGIAAGAEVNTVDSVNAQTGAVILDADDIDDTTTTNKFTTAGDISKLAGIEDGATADQSDAEIATAYGNQVSQVSAGEITAGTEVSIRRMSPADIKSFIDTHAGGGGDLSASDIDTLAELNAIVTDATLIDTNDSRLSDARTPTAHTHPLSEISDASANGRSLIGAADYAAMRTQLNIEDGAQANTVDSVNGATGVVVLDADDLDDTATINKFTTAGDISKLAGIEAGADVTDTVNVTAAGALMDSEVTNLAAVKAFDPTDYATAAQGALADSALQSVAAADITDATVDGIALITSADANPFTDADETKLDGIAAGATANSSDATLLARANHTGTQTLSTISDAGAAAAKGVTGLDSNAVTGTAGAADRLLKWNGDGDAVEAEDQLLFGFALSDETSDLTTGQKIATDVPENCVITRVYVSLVTAPGGAAVQVDVEDEGTTILNSVISVATSTNNAETSSFTGATSSYALTKGDLLSVDVDQIGSTTAGAGGKIYFYGYLTA